MLSRPREPVNKLHLASKYSKAGSGHEGGIEVYDPASGTYLTPSSAEPVHEAALAADYAEASRAGQARARELLETIEDPTETEKAKQEAREELEEITAYLRRDNRKFRDATKAAGDAVRKALDRFLESLLEAGGSSASSQTVRRDFAEHLDRYLINPSRRYASPRARRARGELTGCLIYEPPPDVVWVVRQ
jgi:hypothetical protein